MTFTAYTVILPALPGGGEDLPAVGDGRYCLFSSRAAALDFRDRLASMGDNFRGKVRKVQVTVEEPDNGR